MLIKSDFRRNSFIFTLLLLVSVLFLPSATYAQQRNLDLSSIAIMGDSLSQSFHDGVIHADAQSLNYLTFMSRQMGFELRQGLIAEPGGFGARFFLRDTSRPIRPLDAQTFLNLTLPPIPQAGGRVDPNLRVNNFAIGGAKVTDILNARPSLSSRQDTVFSSLGLPWLLDNPPVVKSQLEFVELVKPKLAILFIGGNDALGSAFDSDLSQLTPLESFRSDYREIVRRTKATGAQMILATVPDVTASGGLVPFSDLPQITRVAPDLLTRLTGLQPGDFITLRTFQSLIDVIFMGRPGPIPEQLILRKSMARKISKRIADYNKVIRQIGRSNDFLVVDVNRFLDNIVKNGFDVPGVAKINARYFGGLPSFDGVHISITANAVLANFFIDAINKFYNRNFPLVDVTPIALADPQVPKTMMTGSEEALQAAPTPEQWIQHREEFERMGKALTDLFK